LDTNDNLRKAVAAEALGGGKTSVYVFKYVEKTAEQRKLIKDALLKNSFMRGLSEDQLNMLIDAMSKIDYPATEKIIKDRVAISFRINREKISKFGKNREKNLKIREKSGKRS